MTFGVNNLKNCLRFRAYGPNVYVFHDDVMDNAVQFVADYNGRRRKMMLLASKSPEALSAQQQILLKVGEAIEKKNYPEILMHMHNLGLDVSERIDYLAWLKEVIGWP
jgi:hypothetical protein